MVLLVIFLSRYDDKLRQARCLGAKKGFSIGLSLALIFFFLFGTYSVGFGFGGYLIAEQGAKGGEILTVFFSVVIGAFSLGQATPNLESLLTAAGSARVVYKTIDRTPPIDSSSEEGAKPEKMMPTIELRNVDFTYPTRPNVQVCCHSCKFVSFLSCIMYQCSAGDACSRLESRSGADSGFGGTFWLWQEHCGTAHSKIL